MLGSLTIAPATRGLGGDFYCSICPLLSRYSNIRRRTARPEQYIPSSSYVHLPGLYHPTALSGENVGPAMFSI